jgi:nitroreductase
MLDDPDLDLLFRTARTFSTQPGTWQDRPVSEALLRQVWDLAKMGPTSANCSPARVVFVTTPEGKARLAPAMDEGEIVGLVQRDTCTALRRVVQGSSPSHILSTDLCRLKLE